MGSSVLRNVVVLVLCGLGCDPAPVDPVETPDAVAETEVVEDAPATQPADLSRTRTLSLEVVPLELTAPESWSVEQRGDFRLLTGPTPNGEARIQIAQRPGMTADQLGYLRTGMEKERKENPAIRVLELRDAEGMKVFERQSVSPAVDGDPDSAVYRWTVTYFVPAADGHDAYELNFIGLSAADFEADGAFLKKIIDSIRLRQGGFSSGA